MGRQMFLSSRVANTTTKSINDDSLLPSPPSNSPDPEMLSRVLYGSEIALRRRILNFVDKPLFHRRYDLTVSQHRMLTNSHVDAIRREGFLTATITGSSIESAVRYNTLIETVALVNHSIEVKLGVTFGLFGGTVRALGSKEQKEYWLPAIESGEESGCFALTELGHGSNVRGIETIAEFDQSTNEFILHTPSDSAQKYWIGGAAQSATAAVVFAHLYVNGTHHGIHVFIVRLRNKLDMSIMPNITIADCGPKPGLNGVDNGRIWFSKVRLPRTAILPKLSHVDSSGVFRSSLPSADARFGAILAALTGGRISISSVAIKTSFLGLMIAIRYSKSRRAFAPAPNQPEVPILFYTSQKRRLMIPLASCFVYYFCARDLTNEWAQISGEGKPLSKQVHLESAGYKALFTWFMQDSLQAAREACGGQGYKSDNEIAHLKADRDVMLTFEGANAVMLQQVGKQLLNSKPTDEIQSTYSTEMKSSNHEKVNTNILSRPFIKRVLSAREQRLINELRVAFQSALTKRKGNTFFAWNDCLSIAERAAIAFLHRNIFEASTRHIETARKVDENCADALALCGRLWAAALISSDPDFLRVGALTRDEASNVTAAVDPLCNQVTAISDDLLKGVDYPDYILAPIAGDWIKHNSRANL